MTVIQTVFDAHVKTHKPTPGQQVNLLIYFLALRLLIPKLTLAEYLEGALRVAGAKEDNLLFPKDALDKYCPSKGSEWEPVERVEMMLTYLNMLEFAVEGNVPEAEIPTFAAFLTTEAPLYKQGDTAPVAPPVAVPAATALPTTPVAAAPQATMVPPGMAAVPVAAPTTRSRRTGAGAPTFEPGTDCSYRAPNGPVLAGRIASVVAGVFTFQASTGEIISGIDPALLEPLEEVPPANPPPNHKTQLQLTAQEANEFAAILAGPPNPAVQIGDPLKTKECQLGAGLIARFDVLNAQPRPSIDAYVLRNGAIVADVPSREVSILGTYDFTVDDVIIQVEVLV